MEIMQILLRDLGPDVDKTTRIHYIAICRNKKTWMAQCMDILPYDMTYYHKISQDRAERTLKLVKLGLFSSYCIII